MGLNHISGLGTSHNCTFSWFDETMVDYLFWGPGQPDNRGGTSCSDTNGEQCMDINAFTADPVVWNDSNCWKTVIGFMCKYNVPTCTTTTTTTMTTTTPSVCCPQNGMWSVWSAGGACSDTCGAFGTISYSRTCLTGESCPCR